MRSIFRVFFIVAVVVHFISFSISSCYCFFQFSIYGISFAHCLFVRSLARSISFFFSLHLLLHFIFLYLFVALLQKVKSGATNGQAYDIHPNKQCSSVNNTEWNQQPVSKYLTWLTNAAHVLTISIFFANSLFVVLFALVSGNKHWIKLAFNIVAAKCIITRPLFLFTVLCDSIDFCTCKLCSPRIWQEFHTKRKTFSSLTTIFIRLWFEFGPSHFYFEKENAPYWMASIANVNELECWFSSD